MKGTGLEENDVQVGGFWLNDFPEKGVIASKTGNQLWFVVLEQVVPEVFIFPIICDYGFPNGRIDGEKTGLTGITDGGEVSKHCALCRRSQ